MPEIHSSQKRASLWAVLFLTLLPILVHLPALTGWLRFDPIYLVSGLTKGSWHTNGLIGGMPGWSDANAGVTTEALGAFAARSWLAGQVPWWNPLAGIGLPLVAEGQTPAMFLPFVLLLAVPHGLLALRMVLMAIGGLASFFLLRRLRLAVLPAVTGAALFELNGSFVWLAHGPMLPVAFLPLVLLGLEQARAGRFPLAAALGTAWMFLAGFPETAALNFLFAAVWAGVRLAQSPRGYALRAGLAVAAGLMLAAPCIWPFLEALPREFLGAHESMAGVGVLRGNWALMLFPYIYGNILQCVTAPGAVGDIWWLAGGYCGIATVGLAIAALRRGAPDSALRWALLAWLLVTAGRVAGLAPFAWLFGLVPLLRQAAVQNYVLPSWSMALAVLAAYALQDWLDGARIRVGRAAVLAVALSAAAIAGFVPDWPALRSIVPPEVPVAAVLVPLAALASVLLLMRAPATAARLAMVAAILISYGAGVATLPLLAGTRARTLDAGGIAFLQAHLGTGRVMSFGPLVPNYGSMFGIAELAHNALPVPRNWVNAVQGRLQPASNGIYFYEGALPDTAHRTASLPGYRAMGVRYILTWPSDSLAGDDANVARVYRGTTMDVWALTGAAQYAEAPGCAITGNRTAMAADCAQPATLLRRELAWPGWRATVNGARTPVSAQDIFQTIALPEGHSVIRFSYAPPGIFWAWCAAWLGVATIVGAGLTKRH
jgi:hypothetical protein